MAEWREDTCSCCGGHGIVSVCSWGDFEGPGECRECGGSGRVFISERDRVALYPGGPLLGSDPGRFAALGPKTDAE